LEWDNYDDFKAAMANVEPMTVEIKILGIYKRGVK
jgi:prephenate dehydratase